MIACAACGTGNADGQKFCGECGARLVAAPREPRRERKVVTVLFCDLVGSTNAADGADPEEVHARLAPFHECCRSVIEGVGGTVEKFIGDAVMAAFGAPAVHEDDPERAVRAGLGLLDAVARLNADLRLDLEIRVGIATGEAVVTTDARPLLGEGMLAGDVVNTAARLQTAAPVGAVLVGQETYLATRATIRYAGHEQVVVRGKADPLEVWVALGGWGSTGEDLADRSRPMIGREDELAQLQRCFSRAARERSVQLVTVVGEPGIGKSRLVQAFFDWIDGLEDLVTWRQGRCRPYGESVAFAAVSDIVKAQAGILDSDDRETVALKLADTLGVLFERSAKDDQTSWLAARLAPLVGLPSTEATQVELFTAWTSFLEALADTGPMVVVVEDLHWADQALLDFMTHLLQHTVPVPLVVVATARPELYDNAPTWAAGHRNATTLTLTPLDEVETAQLVTSLLGTTVLPSGLHAALLERAAGNPLYAREYLTMLRQDAERDLDGPGLTSLSEDLPRTVEAMIAARLDTLAPQPRNLLRAAAVVGETFWSEVLAHMTSVDEEELVGRLHDLVRKDFLRPSRTSRIAGSAEYAFTHGLLTEVSYKQIPRAERGRLHSTVADWYASRITDPSSSPDAATVAHHASRAHDLAVTSGAGDTDVAVLAALAAEWLVHAAQHAGQSNLDVAVAHAMDAIGLTPPDDPQLSRRLIMLGDLCEAAGELPGAKDAYLEAVAVAARSSDDVTGALAQVRLSRAVYEGEHTPYLDSALQTLEAAPAGPELVEAHIRRCGSDFLVGRFAEAIATANTTLELMDRLRITDPVLTLKTLRVRGSSRVWHGDAGGVEDLEDALRLAERHHISEQVIVIQNDLSQSALCTSSAEQARRFAEAARQLADRTGYKTLHLLVSGNLAEDMLILGELDEALQLCTETASRHEALRDYFGWATLRGHGARAEGLLGDVAAARSVVASLLDACDDDVSSSWFLLLAVELAALDPSRTARLEAEALRHRLATVHDGADAPAIEAQYLSRYARALAGERPDLVQAAIDQVPADLVFYADNRRSALATLAEHQGDHALAAHLHEEAADAWADFGYPLEEAHARVGIARCRTAAGEPPDRHQLVRARTLLTDMGAASLVAQVELLLVRSDA